MGKNIWKSSLSNPRLWVIVKWNHFYGIQGGSLGLDYNQPIKRESVVENLVCHQLRNGRQSMKVEFIFELGTGEQFVFFSKSFVSNWKYCHGHQSTKCPKCIN